MPPGRRHAESAARGQAFPDPIIVINPDSNEAVTAAIDASLEPLRLSDGPEIVCQTLAGNSPNPRGRLHDGSVIEPLFRSIAAQERSASAFVIACFDDPGLQLARLATAKPVLGIAESGILTALTFGYRFGVISFLSRSVPGHLRYVAALGLRERFAADLPIWLGASEIGDAQMTMARMTAVGRELRDRHSADAIVIGCAGLASYRDPLEAALGMAIIEPTQAAVAMALGRVRLGWGARLR